MIGRSLLMCYQLHTNQTDLWQFLLPQNAKCFCSLLSNWQARQQGSHQVPSSINCNTLAQYHFIPIQLLSCYALVIYWFFGILKLSYTCAVWKLFLNIDTNQWYLSKYITYVVLPLYGLGIVQRVHKTFALNFYWVALFI